MSFCKELNEGEQPAKKFPKVPMDLDQELTGLTMAVESLQRVMRFHRVALGVIYLALLVAVIKVYA